VVIGGFLETAVSKTQEPKVIVLADDSEVCIRVISDDPIGCVAIGPTCNRDELHRK
jgi:inosine/xanthosine triphosphate pyrophosphatase family protein